MPEIKVLTWLGSCEAGFTVADADLSSNLPHGLFYKGTNPIHWAPSHDSSPPQVLTSLHYYSGG